MIIRKVNAQETSEIFQDILQCEILLKTSSIERTDYFRGISHVREFG